MAKTKVKSADTPPVVAPKAQPNIWSQIKKARDVGVPIVAISTADQNAMVIKVVNLITEQTNAAVQDGEESRDVPPIICWDVARGFRGLNDPGNVAASACGGPDAAGSMFAGLQGATAKLEMDGVAIFMNGGRFLDEIGVIQSLSNLRDEFKASGKTCIILGVAILLPAELEQDVLVLDEPLPDVAALTGVVNEQLQFADPLLDLATRDAAKSEEAVGHTVEAIRGLSLFAAEQTTALAMTRRGVDSDRAWSRKAKTIESTPGLKVWRGGESFDDIGGYDNIKSFLRMIVHGEGRPNAIVFIDEIEKMFAGAQGDLSGVSQDALQVVLTNMQDTRATGVILLGPPGSGKSICAKATGNEAGVPTIALDLGASKGGIIGESETKIRNALKVITAMSNNNSLWIATCNSITSLPPELRRRFKLGTFFFDLPTKEERQQIWQKYSLRYGISGWGDVADAEWTGAEIEQCYDLARRMKCDLKRASSFVVPVAVSAAEQIERLRDQANGRFTSASHEGVYDSRRARANGNAPAGRKMGRLTDE